MCAVITVCLSMVGLPSTILDPALGSFLDSLLNFLALVTVDQLWMSLIVPISLRLDPRR